jgi:N-acetylglucosamine-6-phosphate deacetylase
MSTVVRARHYRTGESLRIDIAGGQYASFAVEQVAPDEAPLPWIAPGLVDLQVNGFGGVDFNRAETLDESAWKRATDALAAHGCTHFLATLITSSGEDRRACLRRIADHLRHDPGNGIGIHLEGPFLNPDPGTRGCHDPSLMVLAEPDWIRRAQDEADGILKLLTLAPEACGPSAFDLIRQTVSLDIRVSIGHSLAMGQALSEAIEAGAEGWTHLGNAAPSPCPKFENVIWSALAEERLAFVSLIPDGIHIPPPAFKSLFRLLGSRCLLTTDAMAGAAAFGIRRTTLGNLNVELRPEGRACLPATGKLAGSTLTPFEGVFQAARMAGTWWPDAWDSFSTRPARWLRLNHFLAPGQPADFCLFHAAPPVLLSTWRRGIPVFQR